MRANVPSRSFGDLLSHGESPCIFGQRRGGLLRGSGLFPGVRRPSAERVGPPPASSHLAGMGVEPVQEVFPTISSIGLSFELHRLRTCVPGRGKGTTPCIGCAEFPSPLCKSPRLGPRSHPGVRPSSPGGEAFVKWGTAASSVRPPTRGHRPRRFPAETLWPYPPPPHPRPRPCHFRWTARTQGPGSFHPHASSPGSTEQVRPPAGARGPVATRRLPWHDTRGSGRYR